MVPGRCNTQASFFFKKRSRESVFEGNSKTLSLKVNPLFVIGPYWSSQFSLLIVLIFSNLRDFVTFLRTIPVSKSDAGTTKRQDLPSNQDLLLSINSKPHEI